MSAEASGCRISTGVAYLLQRVAVCCSVLQCVAVCCSVLQCVAVCCSVCCSVLQCGAVCCSVLQCVAEAKPEFASAAYISTHLFDANTLTHTHTHTHLT